jgi:hypothetical protein
MEENDKLKLDELRKMPASQLTESDRAFLRARSSYLHEHELKSLGIIAGEQPQDEEIIPEDEPVVRAKKSKAKTKTE